MLQFALGQAGLCVQSSSARSHDLQRDQRAENDQAAASPNAPSAKLIEEALAKGDSEAARKLVPALLVTPRVPADTLLRAGAGLAEHDLYPEAAQVFGRCTKDFSQLFECHYNLALAQLALGQYPAALATIDTAPRTSPSGEVSRTYLRGKIETALGTNAEAERDLSAAFAAAPREENYALDLGLFYLRVQKYQKGLAVFKKATSLGKGSPFLQLGLGFAQFLGGESAESIETCRALLSGQPDFSPARVLLAFGLYTRGRIEEAEKVAAQGLREPHPFPYLFYLHGVSLIKLGSQDPALALGDLTVAAQAIPRCSLCYLAMSKAHERKDDRAAAIGDLEKAVIIDPGFAEAWYRLATLSEQAGKPEEAQQARRRFAALKESKTDRETEMLRDVFVKSLSGGP